MSTNGAALAVRNDLLPDNHSWQTMLAMADQFHKSGLMPPAVKNAAGALAIIQKGRELGIPPMAAIEGISIIQGKPACSATLMLGLIKRDYGRGAIRVKTTTEEACTVEWRDEGWDGTSEYTFTIRDAQRAQLVKQGSNWEKYPAAMLRARCIAAVARMAFPEVIGGMYTPEELGGSPAEADIIDVTPARVSAVPADGAAPAGSTEPNGDSGAVAVIDGEFVDAATGEIIEATIAQPNGNGAKPDDPRERAMRHLHAAGRERGLNHEALHRLAFERFGVESMTVLVGDDLARLTAWVKAYDETGWQVVGELIVRVANARVTESQPEGLRMLRETKAAILSADLLRDADLMEVCKRTQSFVRDHLPPIGADRDIGDDEPTNTAGELAGMPPPTYTAGDDKHTR